jgi:hypothetical protein
MEVVGFGVIQSTLVCIGVVRGATARIIEE